MTSTANASASSTKTGVSSAQGPNQQQRQPQQRPSYSAAHKSRKPSQHNAPIAQGQQQSQQQQQQQRPITNGFAGAQAQQQSKALGKAVTNQNAAAMKERMVFLLMGLVGSTVVVTCKAGPKLVGILSAAQIEGDFGLVLKRVRSLKADSASPNDIAQDVPLIESLVVQGKDLVDVTATAIDLAERVTPLPPPVQGQKGPDTFRTDVEITGVPFDGSSDGRQLKRWADEMDELSPVNLPQRQAPVSGALEGGPNRNTSWDQFAINEKKFGTKTNYNEDFYTTKLDRTGSDFKERERKAAAMAQQILNSTTTNAHVAEERNQLTTDHSKMDEEDKYSGVIRNPNAYVPPAMRKTMAAVVAGDAKPALNGIPSGVDPPALPKSIPAASQPLARLPSVNRGTGGQNLPHASAQAASSQQQPSSSGPDNSEALLENFKTFVTEERKRLEPKRATAISKAKDSKLAELRNFAASFKLPMAMPQDILPLLTKDERKQKEIMAATSQGEAIPAVTHLKGPASQTSGTVSSHATPKATEAKLAGDASSRVVFPPQNTVPTKPSSAASELKKAFALPSIPSFKELQAAKASKSMANDSSQAATTTGAGPVPATAAVAKESASSTALGATQAASKTRISALAKEFKPNPNAAAFTPGGASTTPRSGNATPLVPQAAAPPHPFFGYKQIQTLNLMHVKEDFSPFKQTSASVPDPSSISPSWPFTGRSYKALAAPAQNILLSPGSMPMALPDVAFQQPPHVLSAQLGAPPTQLQPNSVPISQSNSQMNSPQQQAQPASIHANLQSQQMPASAIGPVMAPAGGPPVQISQTGVPMSQLHHPYAMQQPHHQGPYLYYQPNFRYPGTPQQHATQGGSTPAFMPGPPPGALPFPPPYMPQPFSPNAAGMMFSPSPNNMKMGGYPNAGTPSNVMTPGMIPHVSRHPSMGGMSNGGGPQASSPAPSAMQFHQQAGSTPPPSTSAQGSQRAGPPYQTNARMPAVAQQPPLTASPR